jgi:quercetin dioxygenase-like cupin family protein
LAIRKINRKRAARKKLPSRFFRELVSHRVLKSRGIALRVVEVLPLNKAGQRHPHSHPGMEEVIYVEKGSGKAWVNGARTTIRGGDAILIPAGARHMMINTGRGPLKLFCAFSAADPENHYQEHPEISYPGK